MNKMLDTSLRVASQGPTGSRAFNYLRFLHNPSGYVLDHASTFTSKPVTPITGSNGALLVAHGEMAVKKFFTENESFQRADGGIFALPGGRDWSRMFDTVLTANGVDHRRRRRLLAPVFHGKVMGPDENVFRATFEKSKFAHPNDDDRFDLVREFRKIAMENMLICLLGLRPSYENMRLANDITDLLAVMAKPSVILLRFPLWGTPYRRWTRRVESAYLRLVNLIDQRRREAPSWDALSVLSHTVDDEGCHLSPQEIAGELHGLFAAGYETTASAMTWSMLTCLSRHDYGLDNLQANIKETQRMIPTVPISLPRRAMQDVEIDSAIILPRGAVVIVSPLLEHRDADVFPEPDRFRPDRWVDSNPSPYAFLPFGAGKRRCPGARFADLQIHVTLELALQRSGWTLTDTHVGYRTKSGIISFPDAPLPIRRGRRVPLERISGPLTRLWRPSE